MQWRGSEQEEGRFDSECQRTRNVALERMEQAWEKIEPDEKKRMEDLCKQLEELKLKAVRDAYLEEGFSAATSQITY